MLLHATQEGVGVSVCVAFNGRFLGGMKMTFQMLRRQSSTS